MLQRDRGNFPQPMKVLSQATTYIRQKYDGIRYLSDDNTDFVIQWARKRFGGHYGL